MKSNQKTIAIRQDKKINLGGFDLTQESMQKCVTYKIKHCYYTFNYEKKV